MEGCSDPLRRQEGASQVPGEMFALAMAAKRERGMGVVGSTQNILDFISANLSLALQQPFSNKCLPPHSSFSVCSFSALRLLVRPVGRACMSLLNFAPRHETESTTPSARHTFWPFRVTHPSAQLGWRPFCQ